ncbi:hypothetical protein BH10ACT2_BH10ACT2_02430 [soil metagenome]
MSELPAPKVRTQQVIALAEEVARQPLPLRTRIVLPTILLLVGLAAFWFGLRDDGANRSPILPSTPTTVVNVETSVVFTAPP